MSKKKRPYDEVNVLRVLSKKKGIQFSGKSIQIDEAQSNLGNSSWGKIDYLVKVHGYNYAVLKASEMKRHHRSYSPKVVQATDTVQQVKSNGHVAKINIASITNQAMKNISRQIN